MTRIRPTSKKAKVDKRHRTNESRTYCKTLVFSKQCDHTGNLINYWVITGWLVIWEHVKLMGQIIHNSVKFIISVKGIGQPSFSYD